MPLNMRVAYPSGLTNGALAKSVLAMPVSILWRALTQHAQAHSF